MKQPNCKRLGTTLNRAILMAYKVQPVRESLQVILVINQLNAKILVLYKFIICVYMFRALGAHHQEAKIVLYSIW